MEFIVDNVGVNTELILCQNSFMKEFEIRYGGIGELLESMIFEYWRCWREERGID